MTTTQADSYPRTLLQIITDLGYRHHAFISWPHMIQRQAAKIVRALKESLEDRFRNQGGGSVFLDARDLSPEFQWDPVLRSELCRSAVTIVILVDSYFQSRYCRLEWAITERLQRERLGATSAGCLLHVKLDATTLPREVDAVGVVSGFERVLLYSRNPATHTAWPRLIEDLTQKLNAIMDMLGRGGRPNWETHEKLAADAEEKVFSWSRTPAPHPRAQFPQFSCGGEGCVIRDGQVITFYSYKGGVGRSMAVANVATQLAQLGHRVLIIDFDFEAPGLHRYFRTPAAGTPANTLGMIDLFTELDRRLEAARPAGGQEITPEAMGAISAALLDDPAYGYEASVRNPSGPKNVSLRVMPAGRFDEGYTGRVRAFDWQRFFGSHDQFFAIFADQLGERYDYTLIDSRTGLTDVGSICTVCLPEKLVLVFTPNVQSLTGALEVGQQAVEQRAAAHDMRPLPLFPLISRVENAEKTLQEEWIKRVREQFETVFRDLYDLPACDLSAYFSEVQIPHRSFYAYGEEIAAEHEPRNQINSLGAAFYAFTQHLKADNPVESTRPAAASPAAEAPESTSLLAAPRPPYAAVAPASAPARVTLASAPSSLGAAEPSVGRVGSRGRWLMAALIISGAALIAAVALFNGRRSTDDKGGARIPKARQWEAAAGLAKGISDPLRAALVCAALAPVDQTPSQAVRDTLAPLKARALPIAEWRIDAGASAGSELQFCGEDQILQVDGTSTVRLWPAAGKGAPVELKHVTTAAEGGRSSVDDPVTSFLSTPSCQSIMTGTAGGVTRRWIPEGKQSTVFAERSQAVVDIDLFAVASSILSLDKSGAISEWSKLGEFERRWRPAGQRRVVVATALPSGRLFVITDQGDGDLAEAPSAPVRGSTAPAPAGGPSGAKVLERGAILSSPDRQAFATIVDGTLRVWHVGSQALPRPVLNVPAHDAETVLGLTSSMLAVANRASDEIRLIRIRDGVTSQVTSGLHVRALALSDDERWLLAGDATGEVVAFALSGGPPHVVARWAGPDGNVALKSVRVNGSGTKALTYYSDGSIRVWRIPPRPEREPEPTWDVLAQTWRTIASCLPVASRVDLLSEPLDDAAAAERRCEADLHRDGAPAAIVSRASPPTVQKIYVHYVDPADKLIAGAVGRDLASRGLSVTSVDAQAGITRGDVRYFFAEDQATAERVAELVRQSMSAHGKRGGALSVLSRDAKTFKNAERGHIEVWLPSLGTHPPAHSHGTSSDEPHVVKF